MARRTSGKVFRRKSGYFLRYQAEGERHFVKLDAKTGSEAAQEAARILRPFSAGLREDRRREAVQALQEATEATAAAVAKANWIPLAEVWQRYPVSYSTRGATRRQLKPRVVTTNAAYWQAFQTWLGTNRKAYRFLEEVTDADAREYVQGLLDGKLHPRTVTYHRNTLNVIWRNAGRPSPWAAIPRYTAAVESRRHLEDDELRKVCSTAPGELRRLFAIGLYTGLRLGDAVELRWKDIRAGWLRRETAKRGVYVSFPVQKDLAAVLADVPVNHRGPYVCPELQAVYTRDPAALSKRVAAHLEACGVTGRTQRYDGSEDPEPVEAPEGEIPAEATPAPPKARAIARVGFHSLRHSFATICARAGVPLGAVAAWLGHTPAVDRIYQHYGPSDAAKVAAALPSGMFTDQAPALPVATGKPLEDLRAAVIAAAGAETDTGKLEAALAMLQ